MASKYKLIGPLGNSYMTRDFKRWVLVFSDGDHEQKWTEVSLLATYCPFCGKPYEEKKED
jgi:hypothetical protein